MRILLVSDAWRPQVNGVVRTWETVRQECLDRGHAFEVIQPGEFRTWPCPTYPEIRLALFPGDKLRRRIEAFDPDAVHIATEGPLGIAARNYLISRGRLFTTSYHTRFPEYLAARAPIPLALGYALMRWFHRPSRAVLVATESIRRDLERRGLRHLYPWSRGVDVELFRPGLEPALALPRPVFLYVGRLAVEKNLEAFLRLDLPGSKLVVGDGPQLAALEQKYPSVHFAGAQHGERLARHYAAGDVFVFPSRTDTFGLVLLEALASGTPVAAFPVPGPLDVIGANPVGVLDEDLQKAALAAMEIPAARCREYALKFSWQACTEQFLASLAYCAPGSPAARWDDGAPLPEQPSLRKVG